MRLLHRHDYRETGVALLGGIGLGALLMYVFDPASGTRRRALARDKVTRVLHKTGDALGARSRDLKNRARGVAAKTRSRVAGERPAGDEVLAERVRSKIGHAVAHPGPVAVSARGGWVTLSGPVLGEEADELLSSVRSLPGVKGVENLLEIHAPAGSR